MLAGARRQAAARYALFSLLMICTCVLASGSERAPGTFALSIDRQPLDGALQQLARQCDVQMIFFSRVTEGLSAPAIEGDYTLDAAMQRLLAGSGLTFRVINPQTVEVRPLQARAAERRRTPEPANAMAADAPMEEVVVVGLVEQLVATRIATPLRDIPQTISIVSAEEMRLRNEDTLADVLTHAPGITMIRVNALDPDFYSRAYAITSFHTDGGAAFSPRIGTAKMFFSKPDMIEFDHVEILRGADGLFGANANPGGTVSLVRKRPQHNFALAFNAAGGSWDDRRFEMDITGPMALDGALRGRAAAVYAHDGYFYGSDATERRKVFGALDYDFTDAATLTAGASYQWDDASLTGSGLPIYSDGQDSRLPRDMSLEFDWTRFRSRLAGVYLQYRQRFGPDWTVKFNASGWRGEEGYAYGTFTPPIAVPTSQLNANAGAEITRRPSSNRQATADLTVSGTLGWLGWREEIAIGADFTRFDLDLDGDVYFNIGEPLRDPRAFDPADYPDPRLTQTPADLHIASNSRQDQYGMFAAARIYFDDAWSIVGGARLSGDSTDGDYTIGSPLLGVEFPFRARYGTDHVVTPYAGLIYTVSPHYSLYASYADIYLAQTFLADSPGKHMRPVSGVNLETGIKGEWRGGALNGSLAIYRIEQSNLPKQESETPSQGGFGVPNCCYTGVSNRSQGVDAELSGELMPGWKIGAGYTYNDNQSPEGDPLSAFTPRHLLKLWTNARLPGALRRWQIGGALHAQTETSERNDFTYCPPPDFGCPRVDVVQPAYAVLDLRAGFEIDRNWQVALSVNNVLDKIYYESIGLTTLRAWYGAPRGWMLRVDARY